MTRPCPPPDRYGWSSGDVFYGQAFALCDAIQAVISPQLSSWHDHTIMAVIHLVEGFDQPPITITTADELVDHVPLHVINEPIIKAVRSAFDAALDTIDWTGYYDEFLPRCRRCGRCFPHDPNHHGWPDVHPCVAA